MEPNEQPPEVRRLCVECLHYKDLGYLVPSHGCGRERMTSPITGERLYRKCEHARGLTGHCGPSGRHWEPRNPQVTSGSLADNGD